MLTARQQHDFNTPGPGLSIDLSEFCHDFLSQLNRFHVIFFLQAISTAAAVLAKLHIKYQIAYNDQKKCN